jgi:hypothetical protein
LGGVTPQLTEPNDASVPSSHSRRAIFSPENSEQRLLKRRKKAAHHKALWRHLAAPFLEPFEVEIQRSLPLSTESSLLFFLVALFRL